MVDLEQQVEHRDREEAVGVFPELGDELVAPEDLLGPDFGPRDEVEHQTHEVEDFGELADAVAEDLHREAAVDVDEAAVEPVEAVQTAVVQVDLFEVVCGDSGQSGATCRSGC